MIDETSKKNRKKFGEGKRKLDFLPRKYFEKFCQDNPETDYDHPILYRDKQHDYFIVSLYPGQRNEEILQEGFEPIPCMYNESCKSYLKVFKYTKTSKVEVEESEE